jgi:hypothetical protein
LTEKKIFFRILTNSFYIFEKQRGNERGETRAGRFLDRWFGSSPRTSCARGFPFSLDRRFLTFLPRGKAEKTRDKTKSGDPGESSDLFFVLLGNTD